MSEKNSYGRFIKASRVDFSPNAQFILVRSIKRGTWVFEEIVRNRYGIRVGQVIKEYPADALDTPKARTTKMEIREYIGEKTAVYILY